MNVKKDIIAVIVGLIIFILLFGSVYTVKQAAPDHATVYVDPEKKIYYAPPYIDNMIAQSKPAQPIDTKRLKAITIKEARGLQYQPDEASKGKGYFTQQYRNLPGFLMEKAGLAKPLPSRWNKDGSWNW